MLSVALFCVKLPWKLVYISGRCLSPKQWQDSCKSYFFKQKMNEFEWSAHGPINFFQFAVSMSVANWFELFKLRGNLNSWPRKRLFALIYIVYLKKVRLLKYYVNRFWKTPESRKIKELQQWRAKFQKRHQAVNEHFAKDIAAWFRN